MREDHFRKHPDYKWKTASYENSNLTPSIEYPTDNIIEDLKKANISNLLLEDNELKNVSSGFKYDKGDLIGSDYLTSPSTESSNSPIDYEPLESPPVFRLGPTPAQLGLKRKGLKSLSSNNTTTVSNDTTNSMAQMDYESTNGSEIELFQSQFNERFQALPEFDFSTYRMTNEWDLSPTSPTMTYNTCTRKRTKSKRPAKDEPKAKRIVGNRFFGPNFSVNNFKGILIPKYLSI